jgi:hypothetical protein
VARRLLSGIRPGSRAPHSGWPTALLYGVLDFLASTSCAGCALTAPHYWRTENRCRREAKDGIADLERWLAEAR